MYFGNSSAEEVAKVVFGEGSVFVGKNHDALVAIAQCIYDEWHTVVINHESVAAKPHLSPRKGSDSWFVARGS